MTPDDYYYPNTTCHHCHNLKHYLFNATKYFTSNTQLLFLPGIHHLHTDLIIQNVHNISLIGNNTASGTAPDVVILCNASIAISVKFINVTNLTINNIAINDCTSYTPLHDDNYGYAVLVIKECSSVLLHRIHISKKFLHTMYALIGINILGDLKFSHVMCYGVYLYYSGTNLAMNNSVISINSYKLHCDDNCDLSSTISLLVLHVPVKNFKVILNISNSSIQEVQQINHWQIPAFHITGNTAVLITDCEFVSNNYLGNFFSFIGTNSTIKLANCRFLNNAARFQLISVIMENNATVHVNNCIFLHNELSDALISLTDTDEAIISNSVFHNNSNGKMLHLKLRTLILNNSNFSNNYHTKNVTHGNVIELFSTNIILINDVMFHMNLMYRSIIQLNFNSLILLRNGTIKFLKNVAICIIDFNYENREETVAIAENTALIFYKNRVCKIFILSLLPFPLCVFQYYSDTQLTDQVSKDKNYSIIFHTNYYIPQVQCYNYMPLDTCRWYPESSFSNMLPSGVNKKYIKFTGNYHVLPQISRNTLCICKDNEHRDCSIKELGYLFSGQTMNIYVSYNTKVFTNSIVKIAFETAVNQLYVTPCIINVIETVQNDNSTCAKVTCTVVFPTDKWCVIFLKISSQSNDYLNMFYIKQYSCPPGFIKIAKRCVCYPKLTQYGVTSCNIDDQTILRPANSWISATPHNNSYIYHIRPQCPFHYCLPHPSLLNFSTANSQCQFNRSGVMCGHCQQGLSSVFASSKCQLCSNIYLFLIIPIAITGLLLVFMLFIVNLTVTEGTINVFIFYVNVTGIHATVLLHTNTLAYMFTSLANFDLGIQTCFYNGMDDYAKIWLQLSFPFYLIFIATSLIITSRYSTKIQRLTARRALPVLATLFLLSYTKILHTVYPLSCSHIPPSLNYPVNSLH